jgi:hypothetical protein
MTYRYTIEGTDPVGMPFYFDAGATVDNAGHAARNVSEVVRYYELRGIVITSITIQQEGE